MSPAILIMPRTHCACNTILHLHYNIASAWNFWTAVLPLSSLRAAAPLRREPLWLCEAIRSACGSLRWGSADPLRHVWLTTRCAGDPLAAAGSEESIFKAISPPAAPGGPRAWGAPAMPGCPARAADNSHALPALGPPAVPLPAGRPVQTPPPRRRRPRSPLAQPIGCPPMRISPAVPSASTSGPAPPLQFPPLKTLFPPPPSVKARWIVVCAPVLKAGRE